MGRLWPLLVALLLLTGGCGYHLRGSGGPGLGAELPRLVLGGAARDGGFAQALRRALRAQGVTVLDAAASDVPELRLVAVDHSREVVSVDRQVRAREYALTSTVRFLLVRPGRPPLGPARVSVRRDLVVDPTRVLGSEQEAQRLFREMRAELAQLVVLRLRLLLSQSRAKLSR